ALFLAVAAVSAQTSEFNVPSPSECISSCNQQGSAGLIEGFSADPKSPNFVASLGLLCEKGPNYGKFMAVAGMCMTKCAKEEQDAFMTYHTSACAWYQANKDAAPTSSVDASVTPTGASSSASSAAPSVSPSASASS
ncbi:hypothetical protein K493DRAFT_197113, partial [Basidiobolus meristosporus CBS 931.73]